MSKTPLSVQVAELKTENKHLRERFDDACAPPIMVGPVVTDHATGDERRMDRAYTEAGMMSLREYVEKWGDAL